MEFARRVDGALMSAARSPHTVLVADDDRAKDFAVGGHFEHAGAARLRLVRGRLVKRAVGRHRERDRIDEAAREVGGFGKSRRQPEERGSFVDPTDRSAADAVDPALRRLRNSPLKQDAERELPRCRLRLGRARSRW